MTLPLADIDAALFRRVESDPAGATVRALVPTVFGAHQLEAKAAATPRPALPWLVYRPGVVSGVSGDMRGVVGTWWAYVAQGSGTYTLRRIAAALGALYGAQHRFAIPDGRVAVTYIGPTFTDEALGLDGIELRLTYNRRG